MYGPTYLPTYIQARRGSKMMMTMDEEEEKRREEEDMKMIRRTMVVRSERRRKRRLSNGGKGIDIDGQDQDDGSTALHKSCYRGDEALVRLLLDAGADPRMYDDQQRCPMEIAQAKKFPECVRILKACTCT